MVRIPSVVFNKATPTIGTTGSKFNALSEVGKIASSVSGSLEKLEYQKQIDIAQKQKEAQELQKIKAERDKRDYDAYIPKARTDFLLRHKELELNVNNIENPQDRIEAYSKGLMSIQNDFNKEAPNDLARQQLNIEFEKKRSDFGIKFLEKNAQQVQLNRIASLTEANSTLNNLSRQGENPNELLNVLKENMENSSSFMPPNEIKETFIKNSQEIKSSHIDYLLENEAVENIEILLSDNKFTKNLPVKVIDATRNQIKKIKEQNKKLLEKSPAAYFEKKSQLDGVEYDHNLTVSHFKKMGVKDENMQIISDKTAKNFVSQMINSNGLSVVENNIRALEDKFGKYYPNVIRDMVKNGLPKEFTFMASMTNPEARRYMYDVVQSGGEKAVKELAQKSGLDNKLFQSEINTSLDNFMEALGNEGKNIANINDIVKSSLSMGHAHFLKNKDISKSVEFVKEILEEDYNFIDYNDKTIRIPNNYDEDDIETGLEYLQNDADILIFQDNLRDIVEENVRDQGYWALTPDQKSMRFYNGVTGVAFSSAKGGFIEYSFEDILKAKQQYDKSFEEELDKNILNPNIYR